jgi:hypothetical protein
MALVSTIALSLIAFGGQQKDWQDGKVLDPERSGYFGGTGDSSTTSGNANGASGADQGATNGSQPAAYHYSFVIEGDKAVYLVRETLKWRWSKPANVKVNGRVKYAVKKRKLIIMDDDGKEHETDILKLTTLRNQ